MSQCLLMKCSAPLGSGCVLNPILTTRLWAEAEQDPEVLLKPLKCGDTPGLLRAGERSTGTETSLAALPASSIQLLQLPTCWCLKTLAAQSGALLLKLNKGTDAGKSTATPVMLNWLFRCQSNATDFPGN